VLFRIDSTCVGETQPRETLSSYQMVKRVRPPRNIDHHEETVRRLQRPSKL